MGARVPGRPTIPDSRPRALVAPVPDRLLPKLLVADRHWEIAVRRDAASPVFFVTY